MVLALWIALQTASAPATVEFDLAKYKPSPVSAGCGGGDATEIVVCGRRRSPNGYPYEEMSRKFAAEPMLAEMGIGGGGKARAYVESVEFPGGQVSRRAMVGIKLPF